MRRGLVVLPGLIVVSALLHAQAPIAFEVASIKRNTSGERGNSMRSMPDGTEVMINSPIRSSTTWCWRALTGALVPS